MSLEDPSRKSDSKWERWYTLPLLLGGLPWHPSCHSRHVGSSDHRLRLNLQAVILDNFTNSSLFAGDRGHMIVAIRSYHPIVRCLPTPPFLDHGTCPQTLDLLPASPYQIFFDRKSHHTFPSDIPPEGVVFRDREYSATFSWNSPVLNYPLTVLAIRLKYMMALLLKMRTLIHRQHRIPA